MSQQVMDAFWNAFKEARESLGRSEVDLNCTGFAYFMGHRNDSDEVVGKAFQEVFDGYARMSSLPYNLIPSDEEGKCKEVAVFVALDAKSMKLKPKHRMSFKEALERIVQHVQGTCAGTTKHILLITSSMDADELAPWLGNIRNFGDVKFDILLRTGNTWKEMDARQF